MYRLSEVIVLLMNPLILDLVKRKPMRAKEGGGRGEKKTNCYLSTLYP